jgi:hypothetical protein
MQIQLTLDGKPADETRLRYLPLTVKTIIEDTDEIAGKNPFYFASVCAEYGIAYTGSPSIPRTLLCCHKLQEIFGFPTENMIAALMAYPIEV